MAGNDDLIARLNGWAEAIRRFDIAAAHTLNEGTTALAERDAQIERLEEHSAARAQDIITLGQQIGQLTRERDELLSRTTEYARQNVDLEARATTAERERDDARAERDRLEDERAEEWRKRRNAEGDRDVLNAANGTLRKELSEARAEVERVNGLAREAALATHRQAYCIQQCAAHIGPDALATINGLPNAVKTVVARAKAAEAEVERKDAALAPFADMADYIDAETEGFSDTDEVQVMFNDLLFARWPISHFRAARAVLAKGGADGDA